MIKLKGRQRALRWVLSGVSLVLLAGAAAPLMLADAVRAEDEEATKAWKNITLLYTTDIKGKIDPCG
jgi:hypothetical protein